MAGQSAPTIYQEYIGGTKHLRVHCFGDEVVCCAITTNLLDWRASLHGEFKEESIGEDLKTKLIALNEALGIDFAIHDLKIGEDGIAYYLETNHQGQFLFVEGMGGGRLIKTFSRYIATRAHEHRNRSHVA